MILSLITIPPGTIVFFVTSYAVDDCCWSELMRSVSQVGLLFLWSAMGVIQMTRAQETVVLVSSFVPGDDGGIQALHLNEESGELRKGHFTAGIPNAFFLAVSPDQKSAYSIDAPTFGGQQEEQIAAFRLDARAGMLTPLNRVTSRGTASCFLETDSTGKCLLLANYSTGSVVSYGIQKDGRLSEPVSFIQHTGSSINESRQKEPHAHCFVISPNNRFAYAADLGTDQIFCYALNPQTAELQPALQPFVRMPPGSGPRHLTFHPGGRWMYVINELKNSVTFMEFLPDSGMLIERQTISTLPADFNGTSYCADLKITPNGKFLYGTNRGHDSVAVYRIAEDSGQLSLVDIVQSHGSGPQNLAITASGHLLLCANMPGNNLSVFRIQPEDGRISPLGSPLTIPGPACIRILANAQ